MTGGVEWTHALEALESWVRTAADALLTRDLALPDAPADLPTTPVPDALRLRAQVVLQQLQRTEGDGLRRRAQLSREQAYASSWCESPTG